MIKIGTLEKLQCCELDLQFPWERRETFISDKMLGFLFPESRDIADFIPIEEISQVSPLNNKNSSRSFRPQGHEEWCRQSIWSNESGADDWFVFAVYTIDGGLNAGRTYFLRADTDEHREDWVYILRQTAKAALRKREARALAMLDAIGRLRVSLRNAHQAAITQTGIAVLVTANFCVSCLQACILFCNHMHNVPITKMRESAQAQLRPLSPANSRLFFNIDVIFTVAFLVELGVNMFVNWFWCASA
jgi:hypothetical protein